jgi:hypothetical protein
VPSPRDADVYVVHDLHDLEDHDDLAQVLLLAVDYHHHESNVDHDLNVLDVDHDVYDDHNADGCNDHDVNHDHDCGTDDDHDIGHDRWFASAAASAAAAIIVVRLGDYDDGTGRIVYDDIAGDHDNCTADNDDVHHRDTSDVASHDRAEHPTGDRSFGRSRNRCWRCGGVVRQRSCVDGQRNGALYRSRRTRTHRTPSTSGLTRRSFLAKSN